MNSGNNNSVDLGTNTERKLDSLTREFNQFVRDLGPNLKKILGFPSYSNHMYQLIKPHLDRLCDICARAKYLLDANRTNRTFSRLFAEIAICYRMLCNAFCNPNFRTEMYLDTQLACIHSPARATNVVTFRAGGKKKRTVKKITTKKRKTIRVRKQKKH